MAKKEALQTREPAALARPSFIREGDTRGTENIGQNDIRFPALKLAQAMSPETKRSESAYIDGLTEGQLFNSVTREIYGEDAVRFLVVNQLGHRNVEFDPNDRNIVLDGNVSDSDPRCQFTTAVVDGEEKRLKPRATKFYDYLILLLRDGADPSVMTLSLKSTQLKKATQINSILKLSKLPAFAHVFTGTPVPEHRGANSWYGWRFDPAGWPSEEQYNMASTLFDAMKEKTIQVEVETDDASKQDEDNIPF